MGFSDVMSPKATDSPPGRGQRWVPESETVSDLVLPNPSQEEGSRLCRVKTHTYQIFGEGELLSWYLEKGF
jgi:hypothetical protein